MKLLEKILVPIDIKVDSKEQINVAIILAKIYKSEIILLSIIPDTKLTDNSKDIIVNHATKTLNDIKLVLVDNMIKVSEPEVIFGEIVDTILEKINSENADLILFSTNEKFIDNKNKLDIAIKQIIRKSDIPLWFVNRKNKPNITNILCPVDFSEPSQRALSNAIFLARGFNVNLKIIHVYEPLEYVSTRFFVDVNAENEHRLKQAKTEMNNFLKKFNLNEINYEFEVKIGIPSIEILDTINDQNIDLLIIGTNGRTGLSHLVMGSVTEDVISENPCSFITVSSSNYKKWIDYFGE